MLAPAEFKKGDRFQHVDPKTATVVMTRLDDEGRWERRERASGRVVDTLGPGRAIGHDTADDWVRYLIEHAGFVKMEDEG